MSKSKSYDVVWCGVVCDCDEINYSIVVRQQTQSGTVIADLLRPNMIPPGPTLLLLLLPLLSLAVGPDITARDRVVKDLPNGVFAGRKLTPKVRREQQRTGVCNCVTTGGREDSDRDETFHQVN